MNQITFSIGCLLLCTALAAGQEPPPPVPHASATNGNKSGLKIGVLSTAQKEGFRIEVKLVQGKRLLEYNFPRGAMIAGFQPESSTSTVAEDGDTSLKKVLAKVVRSETEPDLWNLDDYYADATTLAEPALITVENRPAMFSVQNKKSFDYLVPEDGERFRVSKTPPHELGITVEFTVRTIPGEPVAVELAPLKILQATLDGREPIPGVDLDVGKPIISKRSVETTVRCVLGTPRCVPISTIPGRQTLLLVRVSREAE